MKYPGQPTPPPSWYRDRGESPIEKQFRSELHEMDNLAEQEHWFWDSTKHSRYRVDFLIRDARLIVELDGHDYHSTKEQLERDAVRQRYLTRGGYTVIRFTGSEIRKSTSGCVAELRQIYKERMQRAPAKYRVMYIDYQFVIRETFKALRFYREYHPRKLLVAPSLETFVAHAIDWLHEKSFVTAFVFLPPEEKEAIEYLDESVQEYSKGEVRVSIVCDELYSIDLGDHLMRYSHSFDDFYPVGDDPVYVDPMRSVLPEKFSKEQLGTYTHEYLAGGKLLRKGNDETSFVGTDLARVRWQDVWYPIGASMGLETYEL
jgi:very-short-patch-repair endonuclease